MTDLGRGDVVAAVNDMHVVDHWTGHGDYDIKAGQRAIVAAVRCGRVCTQCGRTGPSLFGLQLEEYPLRPFVLWCPCEWRKIGGSEADTVAQFEEHLVTRRELTPA